LIFIRNLFLQIQKKRNAMLAELKSFKIKQPFNWVSEIFEKLFADKEKEAIIYKNDSTGKERRISYNELYKNITSL
jgi:hypothetical protein